MSTDPFMHPTNHSQGGLIPLNENVFHEYSSIVYKESNNIFDWNQPISNILMEEGCIMTNSPSPITIAIFMSSFYLVLQLKLFPA